MSYRGPTTAALASGALGRELAPPSGHVWTVQAVRAELVTSATAGARTLALEVVDAGGDVVAGTAAGATQGPSLTRSYSFAPGLPDASAFTSATLLVPLAPGLTLGHTMALRLRDLADVDSAGDLVEAHVLVTESARLSGSVAP